MSGNVAHREGEVLKTAQSVLSAVQGHLLQCRKVESRLGKGRENTECIPDSSALITGRVLREALHNVKGRAEAVRGCARLHGAR